MPVVAEGAQRASCAAMRLPRLHPWSIACIALASLTAGAYVVMHPASPDLAAQAFRADLVADHGLVLWDGQWYGGHSTPGYSVVAPLLAAPPSSPPTTHLQALGYAA